MKNFSDFADKNDGPLKGSKFKIDEILNKEIVITGFKKKRSKYPRPNNEECLTIQFYFKEDKENNHILFTGSVILLGQLEKYSENIPFLTKIIKIEKYYTFS